MHLCCNLFCMLNLCVLFTGLNKLSFLQKYVLLSGVKSVGVDMKQQKVTVTGNVEPKKVLKAAQSTKKKVEMWPYVPYTLVAHPYVSQAYDKKAPPNHVRAIPVTATISETTMDDNYTNMFSDENPNACSIM